MHSAFLVLQSVGDTITRPFHLFISSVFYSLIRRLVYQPVRTHKSQLLLNLEFLVMHLYTYIELIQITLLMSACYENTKMVYICIHIELTWSQTNLNQHKEYLPLSYQNPFRVARSYSLQSCERELIYVFISGKNG